MGWRATQYRCLLIRRRQGRRDVVLRCLQATADFYGFSRAFEEWTPGGTVVINGREYCYATGRGPDGLRGGHRIRVCRARSRTGMPKGQTNSIRIDRYATKADYARVAAAIDVPWEWMEGPFGERIRRERWLQMAAVSP